MATIEFKDACMEGYWYTILACTLLLTHDHLVVLFKIMPHFGH
jgi:hypothetical protein